MSKHEYAVLKARDTINNLLDDAMNDEKLTEEQNVLYWQVLRDIITHTVKELTSEQ